MKYNKQNLLSLIHLIGDLCSRQELKWFREQLINHLLLAERESEYSRLRYQKMQLRKKGVEMYKGLVSKELKNSLAEDYMKSAIYWSLNDVSNAILYVFYQLEILLNEYCLAANAANKIKLQPTLFKFSFTENFNINCYDSFFDKNGSAKQITTINIWSKIVFWMLDSDSVKWEKDHHQTISDLCNIRNYVSHRSSSSNNQYVEDKIRYYKLAAFESIGFFFAIPKQVAISFKTIDPEKVIKESVSRHPIELKIVGQIEI